VASYALAGSDAITALYGGDGNYFGSTSSALTEVVDRMATTTMLASSLNPSTAPQGVTYKATLSTGAATGTVVFKDGGTPISGCTAETVVLGSAACVVAGYAAAGSHSITAGYSGDSNYLSSTSTALTQTVLEAPPVEKPAPFRFFAPTSFWNETVPADAPLDPSSASLVETLNNEELAELSARKGPVINTTSWSVPIYTVPAGQPTVRVALHERVSSALQAAWNAVPLPSDAQPAAGTDKHLVVWQPSTNRMWEFWQLEKGSEGWQATWGGAMEDVTANLGVYGPEAWSGALASWGASASSLPLAGGLITLEDLEKGEINHALALAVPNTRKGAYALPAQRTDGQSTELSSLPEGAHLRLDPALNLASLHLPRLTLMMAEAAQRYGIFIRDTASNLAFYAQDPTPTGSNPYAGSHGYYEGKSSMELMASFPWSHLQLLKMELHAAS
jgi:hypothetical protein